MKVKNDDFGGDSVKSPSHYNSHPSGVECIDITQHLNFCLGNAIKYIWRCDDKSKPVEDLKKAIKYLKLEVLKILRKLLSTSSLRSRGEKPSQDRSSARLVFRKTTPLILPDGVREQVVIYTLDGVANYHTSRGEDATDLELDWAFKYLELLDK